MTVIAASVDERLRLAKDAARQIALLDSARKSALLLAVAEAIDEAASEIVAANAEDLERGRADAIGESLLDRLRLDAGRVAALAAAVREVAELPDPVGRVLDTRTLPNGLALQKVAVPFGVVGSIYEARPNVTVDIASLALRSGNAVVLRGGSAAQSSNATLVRVMRDALRGQGVDPEAIQSVDDFGREGARALMNARGLVDVLVPRGSASLIETVVTESTVPVIETGAGVVHVFLDATARDDWARDIVLNAKVQRPSVCNAVETVLVHRDAADRLLPSCWHPSPMPVSPCTAMTRPALTTTASCPRPTTTGPASTERSTSRCAWSTISTRLSRTSVATRPSTRSPSSRPIRLPPTGSWPRSIPPWCS